MIKSLRVESARLFDSLQYFISELSFESLKEYLFSIRCSCSICFLWESICICYKVIMYLRLDSCHTKSVIILKVSLTLCQGQTDMWEEYQKTCSDRYSGWSADFCYWRTSGFCIGVVKVIYAWKTFFSSWLPIIIKRYFVLLSLYILCMISCSTFTGLDPSSVQTEGDGFIRHIWLRVSISISQSSLCYFLCDRRHIDQLPRNLNGCSLIM